MLIAKIEPHFKSRNSLLKEYNRIKIIFGMIRWGNSKWRGKEKKNSNTSGVWEKSEWHNLFIMYFNTICPVKFFFGNSELEIILDLWHFNEKRRNRKWKFYLLAEIFIFFVNFFLKKFFFIAFGTRVFHKESAKLSEKFKRKKIINVLHMCQIWKIKFLLKMIHQLLTFKKIINFKFIFIRWSRNILGNNVKNNNKNAKFSF